MALAAHSLPRRSLPWQLPQGRVSTLTPYSAQGLAPAPSPTAVSKRFTSPGPGLLTRCGHAGGSPHPGRCLLTC